MIVDKLPFFAKCLEDGGTVQIYVRSYPGLDVPADVTTPNMFEYGWSLPIKIPDLTWNEVGISATLSFCRTPYKTFVPWEAVVAMGPKGGGCVVAWENYVPAFVQDSVNPLPAAPSEKKRPALSVVRNNP